MPATSDNKQQLTANDLDCIDMRYIDVDTEYEGFDMKPCSSNIDYSDCRKDRKKTMVPYLHDSSSPDVTQLRFLLECFVLSFGPEGPQLGRNHPDSDPERYATKFNNEYSPYHSISGISRFTGEDDVPVNSNPCRRTSSYDFQFCGSFEENEVAFPDELLLRELSEMRTLLERLLENREMGEWHNENDLLDIMGLLPNSTWSPKESNPHYPVGEWNYKECGVCLETKWLYCRYCCNFSACNNCLQQYYTTKVEQGIIKIECCNPECHRYVHRDEISAKLNVPSKETFYKLLASVNVNRFTKTCPRCSHVTKTRSEGGKSKKRPSVTRILCPACQLEWCFACHAPWHTDMTCKQFLKGDRLLKCWAKEMNQGQLNAQRCPKCKIYIQRTSGCDHMHCTRCKTDFCYRCGDRFRRMKFFGDHYSKLSIFGCKYRYKSDKPVQRKLIRGTIFGSKIVVAPFLGTLALCAGAIAVGLGAFFLPLYGGLRLYRRYEEHKSSKSDRHLPAAFRSECVCELL